MFEGYGAYTEREEISEATGEDKYFEEMEKDNNGLKILAFDVKNKEDIYAPLKYELEISIEDKVELMGVMINFNPLFIENMDENPFKLEERKFPVDFTYPLTEKYIMSIKIPDNYEVVSLPTGIKISLPDNNGSLVYNVAQEGNIIQATSMFNINKAVFLPPEYQGLKTLFNERIAKESEQVILKKKAQ